eukprot:gene10435-10503_t
MNTNNSKKNLYDVVNDFDVAMLVTHTANTIHARPMAIAQIDDDMNGLTTPPLNPKALAYLRWFFFFHAITLTLLATKATSPLLLASLGGTTLFLFGLSTTPAAQPRAVWGDATWVSVTAVVITICVLLLTRTVHPPAGANPLIMIQAHASFSHIGLTVLLGISIISAVAWIWSRLGFGTKKYPWRGSSRPDFAQLPKPGQVSVWDFPRPPQLVLDQREVIVVWGNVEVARTNRAVMALETAHPPTFYLPWADVKQNLFESAVKVAWSYPRPLPGAEQLKDCVALYATSLQCTVGGQPVTPQPGGFYGGWITPELEALAAHAQTESGAKDSLIETAHYKNGDIAPYALTTIGIANPKVSPDGQGVLFLKPGNFAIRIRTLIADHEFVTAETDSTVSIPSIERVKVIIEDLQSKFPNAKIYIAGFINTSSLASVNHELDTRGYEGAVYNHKTYGTDLITMEGGTIAGNVCGPQAHHGYLGIESETVLRIKAWIKQDKQD